MKKTYWSEFYLLVLEVYLCTAIISIHIYLRSRHQYKHPACGTVHYVNGRLV